MHKDQNYRSNNVFEMTNRIYAFVMKFMAPGSMVVQWLVSIMHLGLSHTSTVSIVQLGPSAPVKGLKTATLSYSVRDIEVRSGRSEVYDLSTEKAMCSNPFVSS
jgi:hypothetical protein